MNEHDKTVQPTAPQTAGRPATTDPYEAGYNAGYEAGAADGLTDGFKEGQAKAKENDATEGYARGYEAAREILALCTLAEMPEKAMTLLEQHLSVASARTVLQTISAQVSAAQTIVSHHVHAGDTSAAPRHSPEDFDPRVVFERRQAWGFGIRR